MHLHPPAAPTDDEIRIENRQLAVEVGRLRRENHRLEQALAAAHHHVEFLERTTKRRRRR